MALYPYIAIIRPFTLLLPFLGVISGSLVALGSFTIRGKMGYIEGIERYWTLILLGGLMAATLNAASNIFNQFCEIDIDRQNKPHRVLTSGRMSPSIALGYAIIMYIFSLSIAWWIQPAPGIHHTFWCGVIAAIATVLYSSRPFYLKSRGWLANATIAIMRGCLLSVAGWGCVASVFDIEPWFIGFVFMIFLLGAASTKDFADVRGDRAAGVKTLPVLYGLKNTARIIAPFCVVPWIFLSAGVFLHNPWNSGPILYANRLPILVLGLVLAAYGLFIFRMMYKLDNISTEGNHPAWKHMYMMMIVAQVGLVVCYAV